MSKQLIQVELQQDTCVRVCWVDKLVTAGDKITLKGQEGYWVVMKTYASMDYHEINRGWNNNI